MNDLYEWWSLLAFCIIESLKDSEKPKCWKTYKKMIQIKRICKVLACIVSNWLMKNWQKHYDRPKYCNNSFVVHWFLGVRLPKCGLVSMRLLFLLYNISIYNIQSVAHPKTSECLWYPNKLLHKYLNIRFEHSSPFREREILGYKLIHFRFVVDLGFAERQPFSCHTMFALNELPCKSLFCTDVPLFFG